MAYDPYYEQYQTLRSQEALTGRTNPTSPQALAQIIQGNIAADQSETMKEQAIQGNIDYQKGTLSLGQQRLDEQKKEAKQKTMTSAVSGVTGMMAGGPQAYNNISKW